MASIQRIKSSITGRISYRVQVRAVGLRSQSATFPNRAEAKRWAAHAEAANRRQQFPVLMPFGQVAERYRTEVLPDFDPIAQQGRVTHLAWWERRFSKLSIAEVTREQIAKARDALAREGRPQRRRGKTVASRHARSSATVNRYLYTLSHLFSVAVHDWDLVDRNPVHSVRKNVEPRRRCRFLSDDERRSLLVHCKRSRWPGLYFLVLLAISTGARRSELINLKWSEISWDPSWPELHISETKNGDARFIPLLGKSLALLRRLKNRSRAGSSFVFSAPNGGDEPYRAFDAHWYRALHNARIENFRFHDLRHTCASYLASQGASLLEIADVLGHRSLRMTLHYAHLARHHKRASLEEMARRKGL
jgi:integrase